MVARSPSPAALHPQVHRELVDLLYTSLPQVAAVALAGVAGAAAMAYISGDAGYGAITLALAVSAALRLWWIGRYPRAEALSPTQVRRWELRYGLGASLFGAALGALSIRALQLDDDPGSWLAFGLSMSYCVGMVSRAAVRPWIVLVASGTMLGPIMVSSFVQPEPLYKLGGVLLILFWLTLKEGSRHLSDAFIERIEAKRALAHQATHDPLTGLPNRTALIGALATLAQDGYGGCALVAIDLDRFKPVNDRLGHQAGDALLRQVALRLISCTGPKGLASRIGGDEFMLLLPFRPGQADRDEALRLARRTVKALSRPFALDVPVTIGASAGIAMYRTDEMGDVMAVLGRADAALYAAKNAGGDRWHWAKDEQAA